MEGTGLEGPKRGPRCGLGPFGQFFKSPSLRETISANALLCELDQKIVIETRMCSLFLKTHQFKKAHRHWLHSAYIFKSDVDKKIKT